MRVSLVLGGCRCGCGRTRMKSPFTLAPSLRIDRAVPCRQRANWKLPGHLVRGRARPQTRYAGSCCLEMQVGVLHRRARRKRTSGHGNPPCSKASQGFATAMSKRPTLAYETGPAHPPRLPVTAHLPCLPKFSYVCLLSTP